jgi:hypothetical protein
MLYGLLVSRMKKNNLNILWNMMCSLNISCLVVSAASGNIPGVFISLIGFLSCLFISFSNHKVEKK